MAQLGPASTTNGRIHFTLVHRTSDVPIACLKARRRLSCPRGTTTTATTRTKLIRLCARGVASTPLGPTVRQYVLFGHSTRSQANTTQWFRERRYLENGKYNSLNDWIRDEWEGNYVQNWDANDMIWLANCWQMADISKVSTVAPGLQGDLQGVLGSLKSKALIMPCKTDLYFTVREGSSTVRSRHSQCLSI